ncbi:PhzF family phenazine biosynthesis protein [Sphingomonas alba]|uniref:PhzF family phenazine biosynthesis protein n=1 Tax=Sphingomonas alba TaxID=2908208 RepID=A0ABT0RJ66_9SPHN|nr:PhzF family phenazine biosynthesis protein [Sphingomonas alba]MCL6682652.1 PhzF family phenazine biosynthesis protein [Sphingomonas alba]
MAAPILRYRQVDVFAEEPLAGNGLAVFITEQPLGTNTMQALTRELRQFESIFLTPSPEPDVFAARIFTMEEELPFAGHPAIGAAAVLHEQVGGDEYACTLLLSAGQVALKSRRQGLKYEVAMNQGRVSFGAEIDEREHASWLKCFGLEPRHLGRKMPVCVASTGLPYLVIPVTSEGLASARIAEDGLEERLASVGAKFAYVFDVEEREGRTWDNAGAVEDIATGSAAGPVAGLLVRHGLADTGQRIVLRQGRFVGRPSEMTVEVREGPDQGQCEVILSGRVVTVAHGEFDADVLNHFGDA